MLHCLRSISHQWRINNASGESDVRWASNHRLFVQQFVQASSKQGGGGFTGDQWVPLTKGQLCWKRFYIMTTFDLTKPPKANWDQTCLRHVRFCLQTKSKQFTGSLIMTEGSFRPHAMGWHLPRVNCFTHWGRSNMVTDPLEDENFKFILL